VLGLDGEDETRENRDRHAASFRPRTFSTSARASRSTCPGSSAEARPACPEISPPALSIEALAASEASASFFSR
jgi:hypothetical protein